EDGIRDKLVTGVQTCALPISATPEATLRALVGSPLAHIAAHGHHEPYNPLFSRLELHGGTLMGYDLQRLGRPPRHIVLSACQVRSEERRVGKECRARRGPDE